MIYSDLKTQFLGFINTPSLFEKLDGFTQFKIDNEEIKDFDFSKLNITTKLPLGKRIERFFEFYIENSKKYDLIKSNIQIINDKNTLGELDFIVFDKEKEKFIHIEHIYKFYLYVDSFQNEIDRFIGPNQDDSFSKKIAKLKDKQLPLLYKKETKEYLQGIDINDVEQKVCFKGNIYVPINFLCKELPIINNSCIKGFYLNYDEFLKQKEFKEFEYFLPPRYDWIIDCSKNERWKTFYEILDEVKFLMSHKKSTLVWLKNKRENKTQSFFITWW